MAGNGHDKTKRIRELNDLTRQTFIGAKIMMTSGINALEEALKARVLTTFREFKDFEKGDDPYAQHDLLASRWTASRCSTCVPRPCNRRSNRACSGRRSRSTG